jgi:hypothetical protein
MIIHHPDIKEVNKFLTHGIRLLHHLEKQTDEHAKHNLEAFRLQLGDAWIKMANSLSNPIIQIEETDPQP